VRIPSVLSYIRDHGKINLARLHFMDFRFDPMRAWEGFGRLATIDGQVWDGVGDVVTVSGGGYQSGLSATNMVVTVAAGADVLSDPIITAALKSESRVYGRRYIQYLQFFNEDWQPVDRPKPVFVGVMDRMSFSYTADQRQVILNIETPFVRRRTPRTDYFSGPSQKKRDANDTFLDGLSALRDKTVTWPDY
jgi:hypothetical protein